MTPYRNRSGHSNILAYEMTDESIHVVFKSGNYRNYLYNSIRPGKSTVDQMKILAEQGYGLNSYISSFVKNNFARKW